MLFLKKTKKGKAFPLASTKFRPTPFAGARPGTLLGLSLITSLGLLASCTPTWDFSAYTNTNLIPTDQFSATTWIADPTIDFDDATPGSGGYADNATLRIGLPAASATAPIYRLETLNLIANGDCESATPAFLSQSGGVTINRSLLTGYAGNALDINIPATEKLYFNFPAVTAYTNTNSYAFGFSYSLADTASHYAFGFDGTNPVADLQYILQAQAINTIYRYPFQAGQSSIFPAHLAYNRIGFSWDSTHSNGVALAFQMDNLYVLRSDQSAAVRLAIPVVDPTLLNPRPQLQRGGVYTFKVWVRTDLSAGTANRFHADFLSIGLSDQAGITQGLVVHARNVGPGNWVLDASASPWADWTELTASFTNLFPAGTPAPTDNLQLILSATNLASGSLRTPGSILIADPRLYWSPQ